MPQRKFFVATGILFNLELIIGALCQLLSGMQVIKAYVATSSFTDFGNTKRLANNVPKCYNAMFQTRRIIYDS